MGGREAIRGYLVQTLIALLDALDASVVWKSVTLEPDLESEKVDILWQYSDKSRAVQVKSSENPITKTVANQWALELEDSRTADHYQLILVATSFSKELVRSRKLGDVEVICKPLDITTLLEQAAHRLARFVELHGGFGTTARGRELVVEGLVTRLESHSTESLPMPRSEFEARVREWVSELHGELDKSRIPHGDVSAAAKGQICNDTPAATALREAVTRNYQEYVRRDWTSQWANEGSGGPGSQRPPFIKDQAVRILTLPKEERKKRRRAPDPRPYLRVEYFRSLRSRSHFDEVKGSVWKRLERAELIRAMCASPDKDTLRRVVLTTDAGVGKTTNMRWLHSELNTDPSRLALLVDVGELPSNPRDVIPTLLVNTLRQARGNDESGIRDSDLEAILHWLRSQGRLVLLVDALDQLHGTQLECLGTLRHILGDEHWDGCPIVLGSRPFSLERDWSAIFRDSVAEGWRFLLVEEFDARQQRRYLGSDRYDSIPKEAREILTIPRVLYYLFVSHDDDIRRIKSPSDVYWLATNKLLEEGLRANGVGDLNPYQSRLLLSAIAFEMAAGVRNFRSVERDEMDAFLKRVANRCRSYHEEYSLDWTVDKIKQIAAMNEFLRHGILEAGCPQQIQWRNRSLQEFFAGQWIAKYATAEDVESLWGTIYLHGHTDTADYREVWRFAAEMPEAARDHLSWVRSMAVLFSRNGRGKSGVKRSTEIMCRCWDSMQRYAAGEYGDTESLRVAKYEANKAFREFKAEFPSILRGQRGRNQQRHAILLLESFLPVPKALSSTDDLSFWMGSPDNERHSFDNEPLHKATIATPFELSQVPVTVEQFELFDPQHAGAFDRHRWRKRHPAIHITWYDAWIFCRWLGVGYRLPTEKEWEYACRAGTRTAYSFGDRAHFLRRYAQAGFSWTEYMTAPVACFEPNPWGFYDMHGNCWEWCGNTYHDDPVIADDPAFKGRFRVIRGGSAFKGRTFARSACREYGDPAYTGDAVGFRLARNLNSAKYRTILDAVTRRKSKLRAPAGG